MGTRSTHDSTNEYGDGNWTNPQVQAENQRAIHHETQNQPPPAAGGAGYSMRPDYPQMSAPAQGYTMPPAQPVAAPPPPVITPPAVAPRPRARKRPFRFARRLICTLLAVLTLVTGLAGATAYWAQNTLVDTENFTAMTESLATDQEFQKNMTQAVADDIMASPTISTYLGDGKSDAWYGGVQNWLHDQTYTLINGAASTVVTSEKYPELWAQAINDSHRYNFSGEKRPAMLDLSAIYDEAAGSVQNATGLSVDTSNLPGRTILLDPGESIWPVNASINTLIWFAGLWPLLLVISAACALLSFLLWPGSKFAHLAFIAYVGAGALWLTGALGGGASWLSGMGQGVSNSGVLFFQKLSQVIAVSFADYHNGLAFSVLIAAVVLTLLAILTTLFRLVARPATARFR